MNTDGKRVLIRAFGVEVISAPAKDVDVTAVKNLFSKQAQKKWDLIAERPQGEVELLVGSEHAGLHPVVLEKSQDLRVMKSQFGNGYLLHGRHQGIKVEDVILAENISAIREGKFKVKSASHSVNNQMVVVTIPSTVGEYSAV